MKPVPPHSEEHRRGACERENITRLSDPVRRKKKNTLERNARIVITLDSRKYHFHPQTKSQTPETFKIQYRSLNYTDPLKIKIKRNNLQRRLRVIESVEV